MGIREELRQLRYPEEFRIKPPSWPDDVQSMLLEIASLLREAKSQGGARSSAGGDTARVLSDLGTGLWRIRSRLSEPELKELPELRAVIRHLDSTWDTLTQGGLEVKDHTGDKHTGGEAYQVLAFQPTRGLGRDQVIETIKPTIFLDGKKIQEGEVVVGTRENTEAAPG